MVKEVKIIKAVKLVIGFLILIVGLFFFVITVEDDMVQTIGYKIMGLVFTTIGAYYLTNTIKRKNS